MHSPIFIIGTERSGSNLLRLILNAHSQIAIPHPPHIMRYLAHLQGTYGNLQDDQNMRTLVCDILALINAHIFPWDVPLDPDALVASAPQRSTFGAVAAIYEVVRRRDGAARWGNKSTFMMHFTEEVRAVFPDAKFIFLIRDPRDVAVSARKSVFSPCHPWLSAMLWNEQQSLGLRLCETLPSTNIHPLRYEDLLADPEATLIALCDFLQEPWEPTMLGFFDSGEAKKSARLSESWANTGKPVLQNNTRKFLNELSPSDILLVEATCHEPMVALGYDLTTDPAQHAQPSSVAQLRYRLHNTTMRTGIEWRSMRKDANHWRRWRRDATALGLSLRRGRTVSI